MTANYFSSAYPLSSDQILSFSHDLDVHAAEHPYFFDSKLLQLINKHFGYQTSSLSRHVNNRYCGIIINSSHIADAQSEAEYYSIYFQKHDPFSYAMYEAKKQQQGPILLKSSETLTSSNTQETYTNYLCRVGLKWSLALVYDEYHLVLDKSFQEEDFTAFETSFWAAVYELIAEKYRLQQSLHRTLMTKGMANAVLDDLSMGFLLLNEENNIVDANQSGLQFLTEAMGTNHVAQAACGLVLHALRQILLEKTPPTVVFNENHYALTVNFHDPVRLMKGYKSVTLKLADSTDRIEQMDTEAVFSQQCHLTAREMDVLRLLWRGNTYKEIAATLEIALCTVRTHINNIFQKTGVNNQRALLNKYRSVGHSISQREIRAL